ncbi:BZ3500_MvSof-1268-A1-R1_Chr4-2g07174 [Microbotryum saponariae]|uniref:BZ3500_MvSof-1268-A1-R1_Chr4-2g07174 protein n=1 Tax=Microbotryum saponariae TaxID=289078 RepID=A0A2X0KY30_9BASI|nr:BZ3500_MvSof-1268-A1-R1_Chr4-2g07174 [Microbotryum saponariae]SDA06839.1 BZ3501_MvSof-1269-A2-R1_Chr4-2g06885 [Microbotryum saponariae]
MPRSHGRQRGPSQPRQVLGARVARISPPARHDNNPTDLGIATNIRARCAAVQNGQRGQRLSAMADPTLNATVS